SGVLGLYGPSVTAARMTPVPLAPAARSSRRWLRWLLPVALLALVGAWLASSWRACGQTAEQAKQAVQREVARIALPGGGALGVGEGSFNYNLAHFLGTPADTAVPKTFVFEDLTFQTGTRSRFLSIQGMASAQAPGRKRSVRRGRGPGP